MDFPRYYPSRRSIDPGDYPVKKFRSQSGSELRILYGDKPTGIKLTLQYNGLEDKKAEEFRSHYYSKKGTFEAWHFDVNNIEYRRGWEGVNDNDDDFGNLLGVAVIGNIWRWEKAPVITNVYPGVSNVSVSLIGVLP